MDSTPIPVLRILDSQQISIQDSCDSVNLTKRYVSDINRFVVETTDNVSHNVTVRAIYKKANRIKGQHKFALKRTAHQ